MGEMLLLLDDIFHFKIIYTFSCMILARSRVIHSQSIYHAWHHFQLSGEEFGMMLAGCLLASFSGQKNTRHCHPCCHYIFRGMYIYTYVCSFYLFYLCMRYIYDRKKQIMKQFFHARHSCKDCMSISCQLDAITHHAHVLAESSHSTWSVCDAEGSNLIWVSS